MDDAPLVSVHWLQRNHPAATGYLICYAQSELFEGLFTTDFIPSHIHHQMSALLNDFVDYQSDKMLNRGQRLPFPTDQESQIVTVQIEHGRCADVA